MRRIIPILLVALIAVALVLPALDHGNPVDSKLTPAAAKILNKERQAEEAQVLREAEATLRETNAIIRASR